MQPNYILEHKHNVIENIFKSFKESDHLRAGAGHSNGGQFINKSGNMVDADTLPPEAKKVLNIPPAWKNVKINTNKESDLLATGIDAKGRKQYIYSENATMRMAEIKFARNMDLIKKQGYIIEQNKQNLASDDVKTAEAASVMQLIYVTGIRPGSEAETGSKVKAYGATTLLGKHVVKQKDGSIRLDFIGKKGVHINIPVTDPEVCKMLLKRKKQSGDDGKLFNVSAAEVRLYTKKLNGGSFKPKDFRTLKGTLTALEQVEKVDMPKDMKEYKKVVMEIAKKVAEVLGNTPSIALKSYINPTVFLKLKPAA